MQYSRNWLVALGYLLSSVLLSCYGQSIPDDPSTKGWTLVQNGTSGVSGVELAIISPTLALILDREINNALQIDGHSAWGALFNLETNAVQRPVRILTDSFCASGTFISNGTLVSVGGQPGNGSVNSVDIVGLQGIRLFDQCDDPLGDGCNVFEDPETIHLAVPRWYPTALRISDGSAMIFGGSGINSFYNSNNTGPSIEFFPPKDGGVPRPLPLLVRTFPANLFPIGILLPDGKVLMVANNQTIIYDIDTDTETVLPPIPNNVRVTNPFSGTATLLPLSPPDYIPEVLICGGSNISDALQPAQMSTFTPASDQCVRMAITEEGIAKGWEVDHMLEPRMMPEAILLPNGQVVIVNGCSSGASGFAAMPDTPGSGNCRGPALTPSLYTPTALLGSRFSNKDMPTSTIPRMYHSVASLTGNGNIMIAGSNPNTNVNLTIPEFPTEYRVEFLNPPFMSALRPVLLDMPPKINFNEVVTLSVDIPSHLSQSDMQVSLMDLGFATHATHVSNRLVFLVANLSSDGTTMTLTGPPNGGVYPPGPGFIFLTIDGVTSKGMKVMIGTGEAPPVKTL